MDETSKQGFSLSALFVLVTASAALVAGFTPVVRLASTGEVPLHQLFGASIAGCLVATTLGFIIGLLQFRRELGMLYGTAAGAIIGIPAGLIALLPTAQLTTAGLAMLVGSALIVAVALLNRRVNA